jgi:hypothetical protein
MPRGGAMSGPSTENRQWREFECEGCKMRASKTGRSHAGTARPFAEIPPMCWVAPRELLPSKRQANIPPRQKLSRSRGSVPLDLEGGGVSDVMLSLRGSEIVSLQGPGLKRDVMLRQRGRTGF